MSLTLPPRPNLEHLKGQARQRLRDMQATAPEAQLADAQHALARDYGFASWPKLKAHVEALAAAPTPSEPSPPSDYGFARYTERARRATFFSRWEASQFGSPTIEGGHLLLALVRERHGLGPALGALADLRAVIALRTPGREPLGTSVMIPFGNDARPALAAAVAEADRLLSPRVTTAHLLAGLLRSDAATARLLAERGVDVPAALAELERAPADE
jgi:hypothetical protein